MMLLKCQFHWWRKPEHPEETMHRPTQWRTEGLQRPGANASMGAPPPFGNSCIRPWGKNRQATNLKKKIKKKLKKKN